MSPVRWQRLILAAVALGAFGLSGCFLVRYGVELVVLPGRFHEVLRLHDLRVRQRFDVRSADEKLTRAADELIRLQRPGFAGGSDYGVLPVRTHEGAEAFVLTYRAGEPPAVEKPGMLEAGLHLVAIDGRGRLFGSDFQSPPSRHFFGPHFTQTPGDGGSVIAVSGDPAYFLSVDARPAGGGDAVPPGGPDRSLRAARVLWQLRYGAALAGIHPGSAAHDRRDHEVAPLLVSGRPLPGPPRHREARPGRRPSRAAAPRACGRRPAGADGRRPGK
jgi:hypothetical protein